MRPEELLRMARALPLGPIDLIGAADEKLEVPCEMCIALRSENSDKQQDHVLDQAIAACVEQGFREVTTREGSVMMAQGEVFCELSLDLALNGSRTLQVRIYRKGDDEGRGVPY